MNQQQLCAVAACLAIVVGPVFAKDCDAGRQRYNEAIAAGKGGDMQQAVDYLRESIELCETYKAWYNLGEAYQAQNQQAEAQAAFVRAQSLADNDDAAALAMGRYAEVRRAQDDAVEALTVIQEARQLHSQPPGWMNELALELDEEMAREPLLAANVVRSLTLSGQVQERKFHVVGKQDAALTKHNAVAPVLASPPKPVASLPLANGGGGEAPVAVKATVNIRINFLFDSDQVDNASGAAIDVLAEALVQPAFAGKSFVLIGHTDARGDAAYNQALSERRAATVQQRLLAARPELASRLNTRGEGESQPLYPGNEARVHRMNRRLEVVVN